MPLRVFIVTGTSYGVAAAHRVLEDLGRAARASTGSAPPPPLRVTLGTGQPKLRSMCATPYSAQRISAALPT